MDSISIMELVVHWRAQQQIAFNLPKYNDNHNSRIFSEYTQKK